MAYIVELDRAGPGLPLIRRNLVKFSPEPFRIEPRPRGLRLQTSGAVGGDGGVGLEPVAEACPVPTGNYRVRSVIGLGAATTNVVAQKVNRAPALITSVTFFSTTVAPVATLTAAIKIAGDNDSSGGVGTTGVRLRDDGAVFDVNPFSERQTIYPNFRVDFYPWFIKFIVDNQTAGAVDVVMWASFVYLP